MIVLDREGNFITSWAKGLFTAPPRAAHRRRNDSLYCTDDGDHKVAPNALVSGKVLLTIGIPQQAGAVHGGEPFHPLHPYRAVAKGEIYVSTATAMPACTKIHAGTEKIDKDLGRARHRSRTNSTSSQPRHCCRRLGLCRRPRRTTASRFVDGNGKYETQWNNLHRPAPLCACGGGAVCAQYFNCLAAGPALAE